MMINLTQLSEAWRIFRRSRKVKKRGIKKYKGNADAICKQAVKDCWNGRYFQVSAGHFTEFYMRDFGWCVDSLMKLGYKEEVHKTLEYALEKYSKQGLKTTITPNGKAVDIFMYSPDSLAYLVRSLRVAKAKNLVKKYESFLNKEVRKFYRLVIDEKSGLVRTDMGFGSMKDQSKRKSSCYDNIMAAMLSNELDKLKLNNPMKGYDFKKNIKKMFWNGKFFINDRSGRQTVTGDSNTLPFWSGIFNEKKMLEQVMKKIEQHELDKPFPLKYSGEGDKTHNLIFVERFVPDYETNTCWMHMGPMYVQIVKKVNKRKAAEYKRVYKKIIEKNHNFLELFFANEKPFKSMFYYSDESMLWAANYLTL